MRIRIVAQIGPAAGRSARFLIGSAAGHGLFALALILAPSFKSRPPLIEDSFVVDLVSAPPAGGSQATPPPPTPPEAEPEPEVEPEGVRTEPQPVEPKPEPDPPPKPPQKKPEKKPEPRPQPPKPQPAATGPPSETAGPPGAGSGQPGGATVSALGGVGDVELGWYKVQVTSALYRSWRKPILDGIREVREVHVSFEIQRDGSVRDPRILQESGVPTLDRSALRAVVDAAPLPPLPPNWRERSLPATFIFQLSPE